MTAARLHGTVIAGASTHGVEVIAVHSCTAGRNTTMAEGSARGHSAVFLSPRTSELRESVISYDSDQLDGGVR